MRIKRLDIAGFKSFPDKTTLLFDKPIVGVVGPNGCGKSNIVDAIRWAMGEQSAKAMRGRNREDVIFAGSESRSPLGLCEVTLTFDNRDRLAPPEYLDYPEISITRRLYRDGDSDYLINNTPSRLKDITDLFLGTGAGNRAYSVIEQGRISLIVQAKPEERRFMIEEAAGITRYNSRKREAERKMESTEANLVRIRDVIGELKKQLDSLSRQAKKAERYREFKSRLKTLELAFAAHEFQRLLFESTAAEERLNQLADKQTALSTGLTALEGESEARSLGLAEWERGLVERQESVLRLDQQISLDQRNLEVFTEERGRIGAREEEIGTELAGLASALGTQEAALSELENERRNVLNEASERSLSLENAEAQQRHVVQEYARIQAEAERLKREIFTAMTEGDRAEHRQDTVRHRVRDNEERTERNRREFKEVSDRLEVIEQERAEFVTALGGLRQLKLKLENARNERANRLETEREIYLELEDRLSAERERLTSVRSRLDSLAELDQSLEGFSEGVKAILHEENGRFAPGELFDVLARLIDVESGCEKAVGAALGERLQWLVVAGPESALKGLAYLKEANAGRAGFAVTEGPGVPENMDAPAGTRPLADCAHGSRGVEDLVKRLLSGIYLAADAASAWTHWKDCGGRASFVTREGEFIEAAGALVGGAGETKDQSILRRRREMQELVTQRAELETLTETLAQQRDERVRTIRELETDIESVRREGHQQEIRILEREKDLGHLEAELDRLMRRADALGREVHAYQEEMGRLQDERRELEAQQKAARERQKNLEENLVDFQTRLAEAAEQVELAGAKVTEQRVSAAQAAERKSHLEGALRAARERLAELSSRRERLALERDRGVERVGELNRRLEETRQAMDTRIDERERVQKELVEERARWDQEQTQLRELAERIRQIRKEFDGVKAEAGEIQMLRAELHLKAQHVEQRVQEKYGVVLGEEYPQHLGEAEPGEEESKEIETLRERIEKLGEVNLTAISEYDQVSERYKFLCDQEDDLKRSLEMLESAIKKINRTTRKRFRETYDEVNRRFSELFPQLFGGGVARLELTDPENLLNSGIEIVAQPPGKTLQTVGLLSGGEKALTAVSLIFAIFLYRPTPFCLLDEVDAPLDDINISRFNTTVKRISKNSQFILITHNKKTMEITNTLYGVTMEEPGISKIVSVNLT